MMKLTDVRIGVIGLGYVGLPLAVEFGKRFKTVGFDLNKARVAELRKGHDRTGEVDPDELKAVTSLSVTIDPADLSECNFYIVTVPTPIDAFKRPDLRAMTSASETIGPMLRAGDIVVYESTVYPGVTEDVCAPILEQFSNLKLNEGFFVGYSPERINPGDREHRFTTITKVVAGSTPEAADVVDAVYSAVVTAGTFRAKSIRVAEAAKVIENTQRDVNIALVNEFAELFHRLGLCYTDVLAAARTKWNFLPFEPGLVGGHCIGVDPYYLSHKAREVEFHPALIDAARRVNDRMGRYIANRIVKEMSVRGLKVLGSRILVLGLTFKEDCPDLRNTKVVDLINELKAFGANMVVYDPVADSGQAASEYGIELQSGYGGSDYDVVIVAVRHATFRNGDREPLLRLLETTPLVVDLKNTFPEIGSALRL